MRIPTLLLSIAAIAAAGALRADLAGQAPATQPRAFIDGTGPGWRTLGPNDFARVNDYPDTWRWDGDILKSTGVPIGVMRTRDLFLNFELVVEWRHMKSAGNSGVFAWVPMRALEALPPNDLPKWGIEVQMLDHGYHEFHKKTSGGKPGNWFTTNGDIFAVGNSKLEPFEPRSPDGSRSFPRKDLSKGVGEWNHYYVRGDQRRDSPVGQRRGGVGWSRRRPAHRLPVSRGRGVARRVPQHPRPRTTVGVDLPPSPRLGVRSTPSRRQRSR